MISEFNISLVLLAAGSGKRFQEQHNKQSKEQKKQFYKFNGIEVWEYSLRVFSKINLKEIVLVVHPEDKELYQEKLSQNFFQEKAVDYKLVVGGKERFDSAYQGIIALSGETDFVLVHDAARALLHYDDLKKIVTHLENAETAIIPGVPVVDTIKRVDNKGNIKANLKRENLLAVSTPQAFPYKKIKAAYASFFAQKKENKNDADYAPTDDCEIFLKAGYPAKYVVLNFPNPKLTYKSDVKLFEDTISENLITENLGENSSE